jgi:hypothetical protein
MKTLRSMVKKVGFLWTEPKIPALYDQEFYAKQIEGSLSSARAFMSRLFDFYKPNAVVDVGCGRGTWLQACGELGSEKLIGLDGPWNRQAVMVDQKILFRAVDLEQMLRLEEKVDLAMSLEVAEHLKPEHADLFVESLCSASDVIVFGAALPGQRGTNHVNEQYPSYWAAKFRKNGFIAFDLFRPQFWSDTGVEFFYRQNTFLFVKTSHSLVAELESKGVKEIRNIAFMDCVHPILYGRYANAGIYALLFRLMQRVLPRRASNVLRYFALRYKRN